MYASWDKYFIHRELLHDVDMLIACGNVLLPWASCWPKIKSSSKTLRMVLGGSFAPRCFFPINIILRIQSNFINIRLHTTLSNLHKT